jgi:hypothetical protein
VIVELADVTASVVERLVNVIRRAAPPDAVLVLPDGERVAAAALDRRDRVETYQGKAGHALQRDRPTPKGDP